MEGGRDGARKEGGRGKREEGREEEGEGKKRMERGREQGRKRVEGEGRKEGRKKGGGGEGRKDGGREKGEKEGGRIYIPQLSPPTHSPFNPHVQAKQSNLFPNIVREEHNILLFSHLYQHCI